MNKELIQKVQQGTHPIEKLIETYKRFISNLEFNSKQFDENNPRKKDCERQIDFFKGAIGDLKSVLEELPSTEEAPLQRPYDIFNGQVLMKSLVDRGNEEDLNGFAVVKIIDSKLSSRSGTASTTYLRYDAVIKEVNMQMKKLTLPPQPASNETPVKEEGKEAGKAWLEYIKQFPFLNDTWSTIPEPTQTWFNQQIDIFAGKYPNSKNEVQEVRDKEEVIVCPSCGKNANLNVEYRELDIKGVKWNLPLFGFKCECGQDMTTTTSDTYTMLLIKAMTAGVVSSPQDGEKMSFSEWVNTRTHEIDKAGDKYDSLSDKTKRCIDYAVNRYINSLKRSTPVVNKQSTEP